MKKFPCITFESNSNHHFFSPRRKVFFAEEKPNIQAEKTRMQEKVSGFREKIENKSPADTAQLEKNMGRFAAETLNELNTISTEAFNKLKDDPKAIQELKDAFEECKKRIVEAQRNFFQVAAYVKRKTWISAQVENWQNLYRSYCDSKGNLPLETRFMPFLRSTISQIDTSLQGLDSVLLPEGETIAQRDKFNLQKALRERKKALLADIKNIEIFQELLKNDPGKAIDKLSPEDRAKLQANMKLIGGLSTEIDGMKAQHESLLQNPSESGFFSLQKIMLAFGQRFEEVGREIFGGKIGQGNVNPVSELYQSLWNVSFHPLEVQVSNLKDGLGLNAESQKIIEDIESVLRDANNAETDLKNFKNSKGELQAMSALTANLDQITKTPEQNFQSRFDSTLDAVVEKYGALKKLVWSEKVPPVLRAALSEKIENILQQLKQQKLDLALQNVWSKYGDFTKSFAQNKLQNDPKFLALPESEQKEIWKALILTRINVFDDVESKTYPPIMENFWVGKNLMEKGNFEAGAEKLRAFLDRDVNSTAFFENPQLRSRMKTYIDRAKEMLQDAGEIMDGSKNFFEAKKCLDAGDWAQAKKLFKEYVAAAEKDKNDLNKPALFLNAAKDFLKKIALFQCANVQAKFDSTQPPSQFITGPKGKQKDLDIPNPEYQSYMKYQKVLLAVQARIETGALDFNAAYDEEAKANQLNPTDSFNFLADEMIEEQGTQGLLDLARKYREQGNYSLAEQCFMQYFGPKMRKLQEKQFNIETMRKKWTERPQFMASIQEQVQKNKEDFDAKLKTLPPEEAAKIQWDEGKVRESLINAALEQILPQELQKAAQQNYMRSPENFGTPEEQQAWQEFANMQGIHRQGTWLEPFAMSDAELDDLIQQLPIDMAFIILTAGVASAAGSLATRALLRAGMRQAGQSAWKRGAVEIGARLGGLGVETFTSTITNMGIDELRNEEENKEGGKKSSFQQEWEASWNRIRDKKAVDFVSRLAGSKGLGMLAKGAGRGTKAARFAGSVGNEIFQNALYAGVGSSLNPLQAYGGTDALVDMGVFTAQQLGELVAKTALGKFGRRGGHGAPKGRRTAPPAADIDAPTSSPVPISQQMNIEAPPSAHPVNDNASPKSTPPPSKNRAPNEDSIPPLKQEGEGPVSGDAKTVNIAALKNDGRVNTAEIPSKNAPPIPESRRDTAVADSSPNAPVSVIVRTPKIQGAEKLEPEHLEIVQNIVTASPEARQQHLEQLHQDITQGRIKPEDVPNMLKSIFASRPEFLEDILNYQRLKGESPFPYVSQAHLVRMVLKHETGMVIIRDCLESNLMALEPYTVHELAVHPEGYHYLIMVANRDKSDFISQAHLINMVAAMAQNGMTPEAIARFLDEFQNHEPIVKIPEEYINTIKETADQQFVLYQQVYITDLHNSNQEKNPNKFHDSLQEAFFGMGDPILQRALHDLQQRDPRGYDLLARNLDDISPECAISIFTGNKKEGVDKNGQPVTVYTGKYIHAGGIGSVAEGYYVVGNDTKLHYGAIKTPHDHPGAKRLFQEECENADFMGWIDGPFNQAVIVNPKDGFIVYESSKDAIDLHRYMRQPDSTPLDCLLAVRANMVAAKNMADKGYAHGDLKPANTLIRTDENNQRIQEVNDNNPISKDFINDHGAIYDRGTTPRYSPDLGTCKKIAGNRENGYRAVDAFAIGVMLSDTSGSNGVKLPSNDPGHTKLEDDFLLQTLEQKLPPQEYERVKAELKALADDCKDPEKSSRPDFWDDALRRYDRIIESLPKDNKNSVAPPPASGTRIKVDDASTDAPTVLRDAG